MEVSTWSPSHSRVTQTPLLSPLPADSYANDIRNLRRSLSRSPSRLDISQHQSRLSRRGTPTGNRFCISTASSPQPDSHRREVIRAGTKPVRQSLARTSPIKIPDFSSFEHDSQESGINPASANVYTPHANTTSCAGNTPIATGRSAIRRALSAASDNGNSTTPRSSPPNADGQENEQPANQIFVTQSAPQISEPPIFKLDSPRAMTPSFRSRSREWRPAKSSPLKRSDAIMNLNHATSPAAKRRTICAGQISSPFETFRDTFDDSMDATDSEAEVTSNETSMDITSVLHVNNTRRSAPLVHHGESLSRPRRSLERPSESPRRPKPGLRHRLRLFNESVVSTPEQTDRTRLFPDTPGFGADEEMKVRSGMKLFRANQPHPLSKTLSPTSPTPPSSFGLGIKEQMDQPMANAESTTRLDFSKSLPIGALRQNEQSRSSSLESSQDLSQDSFETPKNYHMARPNPAAFRSTGLISKKHRNAEDLPPPPGGKHRMPDTPIKKGLAGFALVASPTPNHVSVKESALAQPSFDTPSRPFNFNVGRRCATSLKGSNIFGRSTSNHSLSRSESLASLEGDDSQLPLSQQDSQSSTDELPPTPTKDVRNRKSGSLRSSLFGRHPPLGSNTFDPPTPAETLTATTTNKSQVHDPGYAVSQPALRGGGISAVNYTDPSQHSGVNESSLHFSSLHPIQNVHGNQPDTSDLSSPFSRKIRRAPGSDSLRWKPAKPPLPPSVLRTSLPVTTGYVVPQTPVDNGFPDPSGLSISPHYGDQTSPLGARHYAKTNVLTPATPTHHNGHVIPETPRTIVTPSHRGPPEELDPVLTRRFKRVEKVAEGEFSDVYKVYEAPRRSYFEIRRPDDVYAVKKSKIPYHSIKMRENQLREATIMKALSVSSSEGAEHVVRLFDSWEASGHTYFKIEFCNDGNLEQFLDKIGNRDRLDDFRIWKILREVCLGLLHIHDSSYIHLDLKPANIFIAFNGALKIGDFGLACQYPAPMDTEGEGDRRYIAPELLRGHIDKPADVFALGLIIFEIASNKVLPNNGKSWQKLRSGDWSDLEKSDEKSLTTLPSLTSGSTNSLSRHSQASSRNMDCTSNEDFCAYPFKQSSMCDVMEAEESSMPPAFVLDSHDPQSLDSIVHWMMHPDPEMRPTVHQILETAGCQWVNARSRAAGATIDEGPWGPPPQLGKDLMDQDSIMMDV